MSEFFSQLRGPLVSIYNGVSGIITLVAAVFFAICSIGMMVGKNQRTVEEFKAWRTRIMLTWVVFFMLGTIVKFGEEITQNMNYSID